MRYGNATGPSVLIIPPLFGEHNLMRRQMVLVMRALAESGVNSLMPDLPGCNESALPLADQTLSHWQSAMGEAAKQVKATHAFAVRSGALLAPSGIATSLFAPQSGAKMLRSMVRAQSIADREAGRAETAETMMARARVHGITLSGWELDSQMIRELEQAQTPTYPKTYIIDEAQLESAGLWLRAEPGEDAEQAQRIAFQITSHMAMSEQAAS